MSKVMTASEFIKKVKHVESLPTVYYSVSGGNWAKWNGSSWNFDCVILIKAILWGWNENKNHPHGGAVYASNGVKDVNADGMINLCTNVSSDFKNIEPGEVVWCKGHVGVYIGNRQVIEATAAWNKKVQLSTLGQNGERSKNGKYSVKWLKHGKLPYIDYGQTAKPAPTNNQNNNVKELQKVLNTQYGCGLEVDGLFGPLTTNACSKNYLYLGKKAITHVKWLQTRLISKGYSCGKYGIDGSFGNDTLAAVKKFQKDKGLVVDGYVGKDTHKKLVE